MKKLRIAIGSLLALLMLGGMTSSGQVDNAELADLQSSLDTYKKVSLARDVDGLLSFLHPGVFSREPKEQMRKMMTEALANGKAPAMQKIEFQIISPVQPFSQGVFVRVGALSELTMTRPGDVTPQIDALMVGLIKERMGEVETSIDEQKNVIVIKKNSWMLGVKQEGAGWKFIDQHRIGFFFDNKLLPDDLMSMVK